MSDADLRELERRWRETGSVEDEAAWLAARVERGQLDTASILLAAHFDLPAARIAVQRLELSAPQEPLFPEGMSAEGKRAFSAMRPAPPRKCLSDALVFRLSLAVANQTLEAALVEPSLRWPEVSQPVPAPLLDWARRSLGEAEEAALTDRPGDVDFEFDSLAEEASDDDPPSTARDIALASAFMKLGGWDSPSPWDTDPVLALREVVPWALGYRDPVRERVEARQQAEAAGE